MDFKEYLYVMTIVVFIYMVIMAIAQLPDMTFEVLMWVLGIAIVFLCFLGTITKHADEKFVKV